jgi:hypothetical protein
VAPSLTRGWICNLLVQLLLGLTKAVTLGSEFRRTHDHILVSHLRLPQPGGPCPRIYIPKEKVGPVILLGIGFSFLRLLRVAGLRWRYCNPPPLGHYSITNPNPSITVTEHVINGVRSGTELFGRSDWTVGCNELCVVRFESTRRISIADFGILWPATVPRIGSSGLR